MQGYLGFNKHAPVDPTGFFHPHAALLQAHSQEVGIGWNTVLQDMVWQRLDTQVLTEINYVYLLPCKLLKYIAKRQV